MAVRNAGAAGATVPAPPLLKIYGAQLAGVVLMTALLWSWGETRAYSACFGGLIAVLPNALFAGRVFRYRGARASRQVASAFYRGEASKFMLTALLFGGLFANVKPLDGLAVFTAYLLLTGVNWVCAWRIAYGVQH